MKIGFYDSLLLLPLPMLLLQQLLLLLQSLVTLLLALLSRLLLPQLTLPAFDTAVTIAAATLATAKGSFTLQAEQSGINFYILLNVQRLSCLHRELSGTLGKFGRIFCCSQLAILHRSINMTKKPSTKVNKGDKDQIVHSSGTIQR